MLENLQLTIVSTPPIDRLLDAATGFAMRAFCFKHGGHRMYILRIATYNYSLVYDIDQSLWYVWTDPTGAASWPFVDASYDSANNHLIQHATNGTYYSCDVDFNCPDDAGSPPPVSIYTNNFDAELDRIKNLPIQRFYADQVSGSIIKTRWNDSDFATSKWNNFRTTDLSVDRPILTDCGSFYRRAWHHMHQLSTPFRIRSMYLQMDKGTL
jgi:hypothetical protein